MVAKDLGNIAFWVVQIGTAAVPILSSKFFASKKRRQPDQLSNVIEIPPISWMTYRPRIFSPQFPRAVSRRGAKSRKVLSM